MLELTLSPLSVFSVSKSEVLMYVWLMHSQSSDALPVYVFVSPLQDVVQGCVTPGLVISDLVQACGMVCVGLQPLLGWGWDSGLCGASN